MLSRIAYLDFAARFYAQVRYDLATSGLAPIAASELGAAEPDDGQAREAFVAAIAGRYGVGEAEIVPCLGASGAIFAACAALLGPGDRLLVERPSYEPLWRIAEGVGAAIDSVERRRADGFHLDPERVLAGLTPATRLVAITNPQNPTGVVSRDEQLSELASALAARGVGLLIDEAYRELSRPGTTARLLGENVIACGSVTKCWGVPWARAGWLLLPAEHAAAAAHVERYTCGAAPPSCWAWGRVALEHADDLATRAERLQSGKRELVDAFLRRHSAALEWLPPHAKSLYGWIHDRQGRDLSEALERAIETQGVLVAPGRFFGDGASFRLSWTAASDTVAEGLRRLELALGLSPA